MASTAAESTPPQAMETDPNSAFDNNGHDPPELATASRTNEVKPFRFMDLPAELRENVYQLASPAPAQHTKLRVGDCKWPKPRSYPLAQVDRVTRQEALAVHYSKTTFVIRVSKHGCTESHEWLASQDELAISFMRNIQLRHRSNVDHGGEQHLANIYINLLKCSVTLDEKTFVSCNKCIEEEVLPGIVKQIREIVEGIEAVNGRKRLTRSLLDGIIWVAHGMCIP